jgi:DNA sulfur modification protein DndC
MSKIKLKKAEAIIGEMIDQYAYSDRTNRPWIIGFSGGKDSTVLLTLVWTALKRFKENTEHPFQLKRPVYVVCNDTLVENPIISNYVDEVLQKIEVAAREQDLPIFVRKTTPKLEESFWINILGKGYPVPNNKFRWCTDRLKIKPTSNFLHEQIDEIGEAIVLLGTRYEESVNREKTMKKNEIEGERLSKHNTSPNTFVYAPIKEMVLEEIWYIINAVPSPWGYDNEILFQIYADASADDYECPTVVTNKKHSSCGQSRFGCWTCTVVKKDKSMSALIQNGQEWMKPLLKFRDRLVENRNISDNRMTTRRNGAPAIDETGHHQGNYTPKYRADTLKELLMTQKRVQEDKPHISLISNQELIAIQVTWNRDMIFDYSVSDIYREIYGKDINTSGSDHQVDQEKKLLQDICLDEPGYVDLIDNLIELQDSKSLMVTKYGIHNDIEKRIGDYVEKVES